MRTVVHVCVSLMATHRRVRQMRDKATVLTIMCTRVDDTLKGSAVIQHALKRPGPAPRLSDSKLITIALSQELIGEPREDRFFRLR